MPESIVRLACVRHAASVRSEPESNSHVYDQYPGRGKTPPKHRKSPGAVPAQYTSVFAYQDSERLKFTVYPTPEGRQNPEPPPTCPFICSNNEKETADTNPPLFLKKGIVAAVNAVNRVSL